MQIRITLTGVLCGLVLAGASAVACFRIGMFCGGLTSNLQVQHSLKLDVGTVTLSTGHEYVGSGFLDPGKSVLTLTNPEGQRIRLYDGSRIFQEGTPWVAGFTADHGQVAFTDGVCDYTYVIRPHSQTPRAQP
jgi:hypothetical protein